MKKIVSYISGVVLCMMLCACDSTEQTVETASDDELVNYYNTKYHISCEVVDTYTTNLDTINGYQLKTEDGIEFHVLCDAEETGMLTTNKFYRYSDDYGLYWLLANPEIIEPFMNSSYECETFTDLLGGESGYRNGFILHVEDYAELTEAIDLCQEVIVESGVLLPQYKVTAPKDFVDSNNILPVVQFVTNDGFDLGFYMGFASMESPALTSFEKAKELLINNYVNGCRTGRIEEELSEDILSQIGPETIEVLVINGTTLELDHRFVKINIDDKGKDVISEADGYYIYDQGKDASIYELNKITYITDAMGFEVVEQDEDHLALSNGSTTVTFSRENKNYRIEKDGEVVDTEGICNVNNGAINLTVNDFGLLFDMNTEIDCVNCVIIFDSK